MHILGLSMKYMYEKELSLYLSVLCIFHACTSLMYEVHA